MGRTVYRVTREEASDSKAAGKIAKAALGAGWKMTSIQRNSEGWSCCFDQVENFLFTTDIKCKVYAPKVGKVKYGDEVGIPHATDAETSFELGVNYTICSPLSPYALGTEKWQMLCEKAAGRDLSDVFEARIDFKANTIAVFEKEAA